MQIFVLKVCGPCIEFPKVDNTKFENMSSFMYQQYIEYMYGHAFTTPQLVNFDVYLIEPRKLFLVNILMIHLQIKTHLRIDELSKIIILGFSNKN